MKEDEARRHWMLVGMVALGLCLGCIAFRNDGGAIAASIVFAASIYAFKYAL